VAVILSGVEMSGTCERVVEEVNVLLMLTAVDSSWGTCSCYWWNNQQIIVWACGHVVAGEVGRLMVFEPCSGVLDMAVVAGQMQL
jgi:hypothetical protein